MATSILHGFYTSWLKARGDSPSGQRARDLVPGSLDPEMLQTISQLSTYAFLPNVLMSDINAHPVALRYVRLDATRAVLIEVSPSGTDNMNRQGIFFGHAVIFPPELLEYTPAACYWHANIWKTRDDETYLLPSGWGYQPANGMAAPAQLPLPFMQGGITYERMLAYLDEPGQGRRQAAEFLLGAVTHRGAAGPTAVISDTPEHTAIMAAIIGLALPPHLRPHFSFSTYGIRPFESRFAFHLVGVLPGTLQSRERNECACYEAGTPLAANGSASEYARRAIAAFDSKIVTDPSHSQLFHFVDTINDILDPQPELDASLDAFALLPEIVTATAPLNGDHLRALDVLLPHWSDAHLVIDGDIRRSIREALKRTITAAPGSGAVVVMQKLIAVDRLAVAQSNTAEALFGDYAQFALGLLKAGHIGTYTAISEALEAMFGVELACKYLGPNYMRLMADLAPRQNLDGTRLAPMWMTLARYITAAPGFIQPPTGQNLAQLLHYSLTRAYILDKNGKIQQQQDALVQAMLTFCTASDPYHWLRVVRDNDANAKATIFAIYEGLRERYQQHGDVRKQLYAIITKNSPEEAKAILLDQLYQVKKPDLARIAAIIAEACEDVDRPEVRRILVNTAFQAVVTRFQIGLGPAELSEFTMALLRAKVLGYLDGAALDAVTLPLLFNTLLVPPSEADTQLFAELEHVAGSPTPGAPDPARERIAACNGLAHQTLLPAHAPVIRAAVQMLIAPLAPPERSQRYTDIVNTWLKHNFAVTLAARTQMPRPMMGRPPNAMPFAMYGVYHGALLLALYIPSSQPERDLFWSLYWAQIETLITKGQNWVGLAAMMWFWFYGVQDENPPVLSLEKQAVLSTAHTLFHRHRNNGGYKRITGELAQHMSPGDSAYRHFASLLGNDALRPPSSFFSKTNLILIGAAGVIMVALIIVLLKFGNSFAATKTKPPTKTPTPHGLVAPPAATLAIAQRTSSHRVSVPAIKSGGVTMTPTFT
jgi:hypothetical protein